MINKSRGFTLIELLVVIGIIGILASITIAGLNTARSKARDARRISELRNIGIALENYASAHNGMYPYNDADGSNAIESSLGYDTGSNDTPYFGGNYELCLGNEGGWHTGAGFLKTELAPYISLPKDPLNTGNFCYIYIGQQNGQGASMWARGEKTTQWGGAYLYGIVLGTPDNVTYPQDGAFGKIYPVGYPIGTLDNLSAVKGVTQLIGQGEVPKNAQGTPSI